MNKQIINYNIHKSKKQLMKAISLILDAAGEIERMDKFYMPESLDYLPKFLDSVANGLMEIEDNFDQQLLDTWYGKGSELED